jgi:hypothetical protein
VCGGSSPPGGTTKRAGKWRNNRSPPPWSNSIPVKNMGFRTRTPWRKSSRQYRLLTEVGPCVGCFEDFVPGDIAVEAPGDDAIGFAHLECLSVVIVEKHAPGTAVPFTQPLRRTMADHSHRPDFRDRSRKTRAYEGSSSCGVTSNVTKDGSEVATAVVALAVPSN